MRPVKYLEPKTLKEACSLLNRYEESARLIASGQSLIPMLKQGIVIPEYLISIKGLPNLDYIIEKDNCLRIGALTTERTIEISNIVKRRIPVLAEAVKSIGSIQIRNWGTIGGNLAESDPTGDPPTVLLALNASIKVYGVKGEREIPLDEFFIGYMENSMKSDEILTEVIIPYLPTRTGGAYIKDTIRAGDTGIVTIAAIVTLDNQDKVKAATIVLGSQAEIPIRAYQAEKLAIGKTITDNLEAFTEALRVEAKPSQDVLGSIEYKSHLAGVRGREALILAIERAKKF